MYQKRTNKRNSEDAVSPVVGVMLMLVVTIVIAAVVAAFATGVIGDQKAAPTVSATVDLNTKDNTATITFISVSEPIAQSDLQLSLKSTKYAEDIVSEDTEYKLFSQTENIGTSGAVTSGTTVSKDLALVDAGGAKDLDPKETVADAMGDAAKKKAYFAYYTAANGTTDANFDVYEVGDTDDKIKVNLTENDPYIKAMTKVQKNKDGEGATEGGAYIGQYITCNPGYSFQKNKNVIQGVTIEELEAGDKVDVEIIHIPSNAVVYTKTITVGV